MRPEQRDDLAIEDHDRGLQFDVPRLISRRRAVTVFAGSIGSLALAACGSSSDGGGGAAARTPATTASTSAAGDATTEIPDETAGPFPGDGSNGPNVLAENGVVRSDITKSIGDLSGTAGGVPTTIEMTLLDVAGGGKPLAGAAVYIWHCDREGRYEQSAQNLAGTSLDGDNVFSDGHAGQLATTSGDVKRGITAKLNVGV